MEGKKIEENKMKAKKPLTVISKYQLNTQMSNTKTNLRPLLQNQKIRIRHDKETLHCDHHPSEGQAVLKNYYGNYFKFN